MNVEDTNLEAMGAKMYTVSLGYYPDPFGLDFVPRPQKRDVIINRGYWARAEAFRNIVEEFVLACAGRQVVSLGCGLDTLFYRLWSNPKISKSALQYVEVDLPRVVSRKIKLIEKGTRIKAVLGDIKAEEDRLEAGSYRLVGADLTDLEQVERALAGLSPEKETLLVCECVFAYIKDEPFKRLMGWLATRFGKARLLNYEMMNGKDRFGKMMVSNFEAMGVPLVGIDRYPSKEQTLKLMEELGWKGRIQDMLEVYGGLPDRKRIEQIELLDEF